MDKVGFLTTDRRIDKQTDGQLKFSLSPLFRESGGQNDGFF